jgi:eukaryotic-like serine/threonine-protein kinase
MDLQPESVLHDRYRVIEKLGQGGMGAVYLAHDLTLDTRVAVKTNFNPNPESVAQFLQEAQLLAMLRHERLPRVTDYFVIGKEQHLVMDYIPGEDLSQRLDQQGRQPLRVVLVWASQLSSALAYMHQQDPPVTHRDIKPANIKLTSDGDAVLVDFGIAKAASESSMTSAGATGYTPGYAPPEQYGQGCTGPFSDQFSFAATLYALLTGVKPADSIQRVMGKADLIPLRDLNPNVPPNISDALLKAMALQPKLRFNSVESFQAALEDTDFRLDLSGRQALAAATPGQFSVNPSIDSSSEGTKPLSGSDQKKRKTWIVLGFGASAVVLGLLFIVMFLFLVQGNLLRLTTRSVTTPTMTMISAAVTQNPAAAQPEQTEPPTDLPPTPTDSPSVTATAEPSPTIEPEWVGGSGLLAFASDRGDGDTVQIWTMRVSREPNGVLQTDSFTQLTFSPGSKDQPVWSPDGSQIAFVAFGDERTGMDIWVMNADGSDPVNVSWGIGDEFDPEWTPDGERIIFTHHIRDAGNQPIYALAWVKADGTDRVRISQEFVESDPTFSPDGAWVLYVISAQSRHYFHFRGAYDGYEAPRGFDLRAIFGEFGEVSDPAWALSGDQFAYTRHEGSRQNIVLVTYESIQRNGVHHPKEYVLTETGTDTDVAWSTDARWLAFTSTRDAGDQEVYVMTTTGRPQVNLTNRLGVDRSPSWAPVLGE